MERLILAIITDIHHGPTRYTKKGDAALPLLESVGEKIDAGGAELIVDLGDRISNVDHDTDLKLMAEVASVFGQMDTPRAHLLGNHDLHFLTKDENEMALGHSFQSHSKDIKGKHLVFWQIDLTNTYGDNSLPSEDDLKWLREDLERTALPTLIFTHVPLDDAAMVGNFWFQNNSSAASLSNTQKARDIIEASGNVILCVAGHVHWNNISTIDGVRYLTVQSLTESYTTQGTVTGAWAEIIIDDQLSWSVHGADPIHYQAPVRTLDAHWNEPLSPKIIRQQNSRIADPHHPISGVILDMDGVLFCGEEPIEGSAETVSILQDQGVRIVCLTNNARKTPEQYVEKLRNFNIDLNNDDILTSGMAVAQYLMTREDKPKVHLIGSKALVDTVLAAGAIESDDPDYVVASIDLDLKISDMTPAIRHLTNGAQFLATNYDAVIPTHDGPEPEAGPIVAFLEAASGEKAIILGKPHTLLFERAIGKLGVSKDEVILIGDTPATDIAGARATGLRSILVASGNPASSLIDTQEPTLRFANLKAALPFLISRIDT